MSLANNYSKFAYKSISHLATWLPNEHYMLGDYGYFKNRYYFKRLGNLKEDFRINVLPSSREKKYADICLERNLSFKVNPQIKNVVKIKFGTERSCLANFRKLYSVSAKGLNKIQKVVMSLIMDQELNKKVAIVTKVMHAKNSAIFLSSNKDGEVEVEGTLNFVEAKLKDLGININVKTSYNMDHQFIFRAEETTPFFSVSMFLPEHPSLKDIIRQIFKGKHPADPFPSNFLSLISSLYISGKDKKILDISEEILNKEILERDYDLWEDDIHPMNVRMSFYKFKYALENITNKQKISNFIKLMKRPYMKNTLTVMNELFMNYIIESSKGLQAFSSELYRPKNITYIRSFNQLDPSQTFSHIVTEKDNIPWKRE